MAKKSRRLPVDAALTRTVDAALRRHVSEVRDYTHAFHERWKRWGVTTMRGMGWALRPAMIPARHLDFVAAALHARLVRIRHLLRDAAARPGGVASLLPVSRDFQDVVDVAAGVDSADWLSHLRPDGYLFEDRYVLGELNFGNGIAVSCGYTEVLADYWYGHPVLRRLGLDVDRFHRRPLPRYLGVVQRALRPSAKPFVALLAHSKEWDVVLSYPKRILDQFVYVQRELLRRGVESRIVTEQELVVGRDGNPRVVGDARRPDLVLLVTVGTSFLDDPEALLPGGALAHLRGARIGDVAVIKPLAGLLMDKGTLPLLQAQERHFAPDDGDGFRFEVAHTEATLAQDPKRYARKDDWVIKRAFDGKDTYIGVVKTAAQWRTIAASATQVDGYVAQRYESLPKTLLPVFVDEKHLEFVESRVELSAFLYDGTFGGAAARHAPDAEGLVMTDPPKDYGYSTVFGV